MTSINPYGEEIKCYLDTIATFRISIQLLDEAVTTCVKRIFTWIRAADVRPNTVQDTRIFYALSSSLKADLRSYYLQKISGIYREVVLSLTEEEMQSVASFIGKGVSGIHTSTSRFTGEITCCYILPEFEKFYEHVFAAEEELNIDSLKKDLIDRGMKILYNDKKFEDITGIDASLIRASLPNR